MSRILLKRPRRVDRVQPDGNAPGDKADRWAVYVGLWAPTFMALGNAIQAAEDNREND